jgi:hypothetical protein
LEPRSHSHSFLPVHPAHDDLRVLSSSVEIPQVTKIRVRCDEEKSWRFGHAGMVPEPLFTSRPGPSSMYLRFDVVIINFYQFSDAQNKVNYQTDNAIDIYTFYLAVALIVELVAVYLLIKDINRSFLSKKQSILLAVLIGLFMMGSLVSEAIMTAELFI